jgi:hypothetical protein
MSKAPLRLLLLLLCFTASMPAMADALYRCLGAHGAVSYQSQACTTGQRLDRVVAYQLESVAIQAPKLSRRDPRYRSTINMRKRSRSMQARTHTITTNDRCHLAKAKREQALERLGLRRNYQQLSQLNAVVRSQCRG